MNEMYILRNITTLNNNLSYHYKMYVTALIVLFVIKVYQ